MAGKPLAAKSFWNGLVHLDAPAHDSSTARPRCVFARQTREETHMEPDEYGPQKEDTLSDNFKFHVGLFQGVSSIL